MTAIERDNPSLKGVLPKDFGRLGLDKHASVKSEEVAIQGGRKRGVILRKLIEEVLTGETTEDAPALVLRASALINQLGLVDLTDAASGLSSVEMATSVRHALHLPEIVAPRSENDTKS